MIELTEPTTFIIFVMSNVITLLVTILVKRGK